MLTVLVSTISNLQVFLQMQKLLTFFSKNICVYAIFNDQRYNDTLTYEIVSFEQLGPEKHKRCHGGKSVTRKYSPLNSARSGAFPFHFIPNLLQWTR